MASARLNNVSLHLCPINSPTHVASRSPAALADRADLLKVEQELVSLPFFLRLLTCPHVLCEPVTGKCPKVTAENGAGLHVALELLQLCLVGLGFLVGLPPKSRQRRVALSE